MAPRFPGDLGRVLRLECRRGVNAQQGGVSSGGSWAAPRCRRQHAGRTGQGGAPLGILLQPQLSSCPRELGRWGPEPLPSPHSPSSGAGSGSLPHLHGQVLTAASEG